MSESMSVTGAPPSAAPSTPAPAAVDASPNSAKVDTSAGKTTEPAKPQKIKIPVNGGEEEVDVDYLAREYSKFKGSEKKFEEAAKLRKEAEELTKGDLRELARRQGLDPEEMAAKWLEEAIAKTQMSPEARELAELKAQMAANEKQTQAEKAAQAAKEVEANTTQATQAAVQAIDSVVDKLGLPKSPAIRYRTAQYAEWMHRTQGRVDLQECAELAQKDLGTDMGHVIDSTPEEKLIEQIGKARALKIGRALAKILRAAPQKPAAATSSRAEQRTQQLNQPRIFNEFLPDSQAWRK